MYEQIESMPSSMSLYDLLKLKSRVSYFIQAKTSTATVRRIAAEENDQEHGPAIEGQEIAVVKKVEPKQEN